jgi:hypothetical protein
MPNRSTSYLKPLITLLVCLLTTTALASGCEEKIEKHMIGEAMLPAQFVAAAEKAGMKPLEINGVLKSVAEHSAIEEFWITDSSGHAYLTNTGVDFTFSPDPKQQPQASAFWPLLKGQGKVIVQEARKREIDDRVFKYVGVAGIDKPRIVQVGVSADNLCR